MLVLIKTFHLQLPNKTLHGDLPDRLLFVCEHFYHVLVKDILKRFHFDWRILTMIIRERFFHFISKSRLSFRDFSCTDLGIKDALVLPA